MRALLMVGLLVAAPVAAASASDVPATGSWTQLRVATPFGDSPDLQAQDGPALPVENGPAGVIAFSAVRWTQPADLTLARVDTTAAASAPEVWACPATAWPTGDRQPWARHPAVDCTRHVVGTASVDRMTWRTSAFGTAVDVVLVPAPSDRSAFAVSFGAPTVDSFAGPPTSPVPPVAEPPPAPARPAVAAPVVPHVSLLADRPAPQQAPAAAPVPAVPPRSVEARPAELAGSGSDGPAAWPGRLLLAFLSLLLVARAAFPSRSPRPPSSLVPGRAAPPLP
jgi:hypothetical protein